jgi:hypothetical protein
MSAPIQNGIDQGKNAIISTVAMMPNAHHETNSNAA